MKSVLNIKLTVTKYEDNPSGKHHRVEITTGNQYFDKIWDYFSIEDMSNISFMKNLIKKVAGIEVEELVELKETTEWHNPIKVSSEANFYYYESIYDKLVEEVEKELIYEKFKHFRYSYSRGDVSTLFSDNQMFVVVKGGSFPFTDEPSFQEAFKEAIRFLNAVQEEESDESVVWVNDEKASLTELEDGEKLIIKEHNTKIVNALLSTQGNQENYKKSYDRVGHLEVDCSEGCEENCKYLYSDGINNFWLMEREFEYPHFAIKEIIKSDRLNPVFL
jgi:hypothetical protein